MLHLVMTIIVGLLTQPTDPLQTGPQGGTNTPPQQSDRVPLEGEHFISNEVGITMTLPKGSIITSQKTGPSPFFVIRDGSRTPAWSLRLESVPSSDPTAEAMIRRMMLSGDKKDSTIEILREQSLTINGEPAYLAWVRERLEDGQNVVFGWIVLPQGRLMGQLHYLVGTVITIPDRYPLVQPELEAAMGTIQLRGPEKAGELAYREAENAKTFLAGLSEETLKASTNHRTCRRIYRPGQDGEPDEEIAYSVFSIEAAPMGTLQPGSFSELYRHDEQEEGLLVKVHSRIVVDADREIYIDMLGQYWLAWDLSHEAWTAFVTRRQRAATRTEKEYGFRTKQTLGDPRSRIVVIKQDDEINLRQPYEWVTPSPWMPRALTWTLGMFLPREEPLSMSYAFFDHRQSDPQIGTRRDDWTPSGSTANQWLLQTWMDDAGLPTKGVYGIDGLLRQNNPDGVIVETTTPDRIELIWNQAGLKTS